MTRTHLFKFTVYFFVLELYFMSNRVLCRSYKTYTIEICNPIETRQKLDEKLSDDNPMLIVTSGYKFDSWFLKPNMSCHFVVETKDKTDGVFAVIQNMNLRSSNAECQDYVQFTRNEHNHTQQFCGPFNRRSFISEQKNHGNKLLYSLSDSHGKIDTKIFVSKKPFDRSFTPNITIVYTLFKDCRNVDSHVYRSVVKEKNICILDDYFCDGIYNCGGMDGCLDEENCTYPTSIVSSGTGTKVTVAAVTTIFLCLIIFLMCLWICRKQKKLCWSSDCAGRTPNADNSNLSLNLNQNNTANRVIPTSPMLEPTPTTMQDKDLPPSYDSLYPNTANVAPT